MAEGDGILVARLAAGDEDAVADVYDRYGAAVYRIARRLTGGDALAEDVTQEVMVALWRRPERFDPARGSLRAFLCLQARCRALDAIRRASARISAEAGRGASEPWTDAADGDVASAADTSITAGLIHDAIRALPNDQRRVVELAYFEGRSHREVASALEIPLGTVKGRLRLAHEKLRRILAPVVAVSQ